MNYLKNTRSVLARLLRRKPAARPPPLEQSPKAVESTSGRRWYHDRRKVAATVPISGGAAVYYGNLETVPYTNRTHFILLPHALEQKFGERGFAELKEELGPKILPPIHPDSLRVRRIFSEIVRAVPRSLGADRCSDVVYTSSDLAVRNRDNDADVDAAMLRGGSPRKDEDEEEVPDDDGGLAESRDTDADVDAAPRKVDEEEEEVLDDDGGLAESRDTNADVDAAMLGDGSPRKDDDDEEEVLEDGWLAKSRRKQEAAWTARRRPDGISWDWEVIVVRDEEVNVERHPGGKIVVYTGVFDHLSTDAETASVLAHEVGHVIARHFAEMGTKLIALEPILPVSFRTKMLDLGHRLYSWPRIERDLIEADYIGILLLGAAGYDPNVALTVEEKLWRGGTNMRITSLLILRAIKDGSFYRNPR